jgi:hypothetical protein
MIDMETWLPQILDYCSFVVDEKKIRQAWVDRDFSETSVTDFDELYEQVFDDLDAERFVTDLSMKWPTTAPERAVIAEFLASLQDADRARSSHAELRNASDLLNSSHWGRVRSSALAVLGVVNAVKSSGLGLS